MRRRSSVLAVVATLVASATAIAVPSSASAAPVGCSLVMPAKVVIDSPIEEAGVRLSSGCTAAQAERAVWELRHPAATGAMELGFEAEDLRAGRTTGVVEYYDDDPKGAWTARPRGSTTAGGGQLTQNTPVTVVKYGSRVTTRVSRTSGTLTWAATATSWSGSVHRWYPRARATVSLWHLPSGSSGWTWVKAVRTSTSGKATVTMTVPKAGMYRLGIGGTPSAWGAWTRPIRGRL